VSDHLVPRPTGEPVRLEFVPAQASGRGVKPVVQRGAPQLRRSYRLEWRAVSCPLGSRRRREKRESGVRSGIVPGRLAPERWGLEAEAVEQADAADEGRLEASGGIMVGPVTANQGKVVRPSQLIRRVRPTGARWSVRAS
jgi:hypothetical protein